MALHGCLSLMGCGKTIKIPKNVPNVAFACFTSIYMHFSYSYFYVLTGSRMLSVPCK